MSYDNFITFKVQIDNAIAWVTLDYPPVNLQGQAMLADLNSLAMRLERDREIRVVVFQSAHPEIWVCHYDTNLLKDMSREAVSRDEAELLDLQSVLERISKVPQATIAKLEGFARGGGHEFALACDMRFCGTGQVQVHADGGRDGYPALWRRCITHGASGRAWPRPGNHPERP